MFKKLLNSCRQGCSAIGRTFSTTSKIVTGSTIFGLMDNHWKIKEYRMKGSVEGQKTLLNGLRTYQIASTKNDKIIATHEIREGIELISRVSYNTSIWEYFKLSLGKIDPRPYINPRPSYRHWASLNLTYMEQQAQATLLKLEQTMKEKFEDQALRAFIDEGKTINYAFRPAEPVKFGDENPKQKSVEKSAAATEISPQATENSTNKPNKKPD